jgi:hypothetical protein
MLKFSDLIKSFFKFSSSRERLNDASFVTNWFSKVLVRVGNLQEVFVGVATSGNFNLVFVHQKTVFYVGF